MIEALVTSVGLYLGNAELLWIRSHDQMDSVQLIVGSSMQSLQQTPDRWLYFSMSECLEWNPKLPGCLLSHMQVSLTADVGYDLVAWSEAENRQEPQREMVLIAEGWTFHPADVNMDGAVDCEDLEFYKTSQYDWNLDGETTAADGKDLASAATASSAELDGDGVVDLDDLLLLLAQWGVCPDPHAPCPADLNCDGTVGVLDFMLLLSLMEP